MSTDFDIHGVQYSHICGRVIGYQRNSLDGLHYHSRGVDGIYVFGVSLTHSQSPRQHIWTFTGARDESSGERSTFKCPCVNPNLSLFLVLLEMTTSVILP